MVFPEGSRTPDGQVCEAGPGIGLITVNIEPPVFLTPEERAAKTKGDYDRIAKRVMAAIEALGDFRKD